MGRIVVASLLVLAGTYSVSAQAQEVAQPYFEKGVPAPARAFEIGVSAAYNQGWGNLTDTQSFATQQFGGRQVQDVAGAGLALGLDLGYRVSPMLAVGVYGTIAQYTNQTNISGTDLRSLTAGIQGAWHLRPFKSVDPWLTLGSAYRGSWLVPDVGDNISRQGWEIARLQVGADFRLAPQVAIAPFVAGDFNMIFSESVPGGNSRNLDGPPVYASFTAGVMGRFDIGGTYIRQGGAVASK